MPSQSKILGIAHDAAMPNKPKTPGIAKKMIEKTQEHL